MNLLFEPGHPNCEFSETERPPRVPSEVEGRGEGLIVLAPELVRVRSEERTQFRVEEGAEVGVFAFSEKLGRKERIGSTGALEADKIFFFFAYKPEFFVIEGGDGSEFELEEMT